jgi:gluconate 2-dehydrogenase gamma chain
MDRVVPADTDQGAWEAGCGDFLIRLLEDDLADRDLYRKGLDSLDNEANQVFHTSFDRLTSEEQDDLLTSVEVGSVSTRWAVLPGLFFRTLVKNTMEGYYGSPGNGGNREALAWKMIGFEVTG